MLNSLFIKNPISSNEIQLTSLSSICTQKKSVHYDAMDTSSSFEMTTIMGFANSFNVQCLSLSNENVFVVYTVVDKQIRTSRAPGFLHKCSKLHGMF